MVCIRSGSCEIDTILRKNLEAAAEQYDLSVEQFREAISEMGTGMFDGGLKLRKAAERLRRATAEMRCALQQQTDFVVSGIVPKSLSLPRF